MVHRPVLRLHRAHIQTVLRRTHINLAALAQIRTRYLHRRNLGRRRQIRPHKRPRQKRRILRFAKRIVHRKNELDHAPKRLHRTKHRQHARLAHHRPATHRVLHRRLDLFKRSPIPANPAQHRRLKTYRHPKNIRGHHRAQSAIPRNVLPHRHRRIFQHPVKRHPHNAAIIVELRRPDIVPGNLHRRNGVLQLWLPTDQRRFPVRKIRIQNPRLQRLEFRLGRPTLGLLKHQRRLLLTQSYARIVQRNLVIFRRNPGNHIPLPETRPGIISRIHPDHAATHLTPE